MIFCRLRNILLYKNTFSLYKKLETQNLYSFIVYIITQFGPIFSDTQKQKFIQLKENKS
jgi:hypothetical protein